MILTSHCSSITGKILYSDTYELLDDSAAEANNSTTGWDWPRHADSYARHRVSRLPLLNRLEGIPILGHVAAAFRIALGTIHIIGHLLAALIFWNKEHLPHAAKGCTEVLRGIIAFIPVVGRLFVWYYDGQCCAPRRDWSFFIIKIYNPDDLDPIDHQLFIKSSV